MTVAASDPFLPEVKKLVEEHRKLQDEPLLVAVYGRLPAHPEDPTLFEIIDGFGAGRIDEDKKLFEVSFASSTSFPLNAGRRLRLVLTNPEEFEVALREKWPSLEEILDAVHAGAADFLFVADPAASHLRAKFNG